MIDLISMYMLQQSLGGSSSGGSEEEKITKEDISTTIIEKTNVMGSWKSLETTFSEEHPEYDNTGIAYGNGIYILANSEKSYYSTDCLNWIKIVKNEESFPLDNVLFNNISNYFIGYKISEDMMTSFYRSKDGKEWNWAGAYKITDTGNSIWPEVINFDYLSDGSIVAIDDFHIALGSGLNSFTWTTLSISPKGDGYFKKVICKNGKILVIDTENYYYVSSDSGSTWKTGKILNENDYNSTPQIYSVGFDGTNFIAAFYCRTMGVAYSSTDGITWTKSSYSVEMYPNSIAFGNGIMECGNRQSIVYFDGENFIKISTSSDSIRMRSCEVNESTIIISPIILKNVLSAGETSLSFSNSNINTNSLLTFYTSKYILNPSNIEVTNGKVIVTYPVQDTDITVMVKIEG